MGKIVKPNRKTTHTTEENHFEWVSENINATVGEQLGGLEQASAEASAIANNENLTTETAVTAQALNAVDAGIQAFGAVTGLANNLAESAILPILGALGLQGLACLPISKQLDPVLGIDMHLILFPPAPVPVPMPHPYIGMLFRSKDFIAAAIASFIPPPPEPPAAQDPSVVSEEEQQQAANTNKAITIGHTVATMAVGMLGATVKIGGFIPRVVAGTPTKSIPHFPMGPSFYPAATAAIEKNKGHALFGSMFALADDDPISGSGVHLHNSCWDIGGPSPHTFRKSKNTDDETKSKLQLFLPTGLITPIPMATSILTNPVPAPFNPMAIATKAAKGAFGRHFKKLAAAIGHGAVNKLIGSEKLRNKLHNDICTKTGHPVDVASGMFFTDEEDFILTGPIPLSWQRTWYAESDYKGPLGNGWHHSYDIGIVIDPVENNITLRMEDGRPIAFRTPQLHSPTFNKAELLEMRVNEAGDYYIWNIKEEVYYYFTKKEFKQVHLLRSIVNPNSFSLQFKYNNQGHLQHIIDSAHRTLTLTNDPEGRILTIEAPHPETPHETFTIAHYHYDATGNMLQQTNAVGDSMYFEYQGHLMTKETWRNGLNWYFKYDGTSIGSRCIHTWGDGNIQNHKLTFFKTHTQVTNSLGHITEYHHKNGLVTKRIDPNGAAHHWLYDKDNQLLSETDPLGNSHMYSYDTYGNQTQIVAPTGATIITDHTNTDHPHVPTEATDANGGTWKWKHDDQGNVIERHNPMGAISTIQHKDGLVKTITDALGNTTTLAYTPDYQIKKVTDSQGNHTHYQYDTLGRCTQITNAKGATQKRTFDLVDRIIQVEDFDGNQIALTYDGIDNLIQYKDHQQEVKYQYKGMWKLTQRTDKRGTTHYYYNTEEQLTEIINEKNIPYTFTLDSVGNVVQETGFDQESKKYKRDLAGRVVELTKASGKTTQYQYDKGSRITQITQDNQETQNFAYNNAGQLLVAENQDAKVTFTRNKLGLITKETVNEHTLTHHYNTLGIRTKIQSSLGAHIDYTHDTFGNLAHLTATQQENQWQAKYTYDSLGFELERLLPGTLAQKFDYDTIGRLTSQETHKSKKQKHKRTYTWGTNDRLQAIADSKQGITTYGYTPTGHLEHTTTPESTHYRTPDSVGNLYETPEKKDREYAYGGKLIKKGAWHYKYDDEGFLIEKYKGSSSLFSSKTDRWQYQWNAEGMLEAVKRPDSHIITFTYDALGRRLTKTFKNTTTRWLWDGNVPLHEWKENANGDILSNSSVGDNGMITWVFEENSFIPTAKLKGDKKFSILADHLGTPTQMYNEEGDAVWERSLDSNGKVKTGDNSSCPFMYQGQYYDKEIGLAYNRFRYYDPNDGRYISVDPIGLFSGENNFYSYVNNPNGWVDIFGLSSYKKLKGTDKLDDLTVLDKYKNKPQNGHKVNTSIKDGKIYVDGKLANDSYDFVITQNGELMMGAGHYHLSDMADNVKGAGVVNITNGKIDYIDNNSGHYVPEMNQTFSTLQVLGGDNGLAVPPSEMSVVNMAP